MPVPRPTPLPLSIETVVGTVFRLYIAKFKDYAKVALWATLWLWLWIVPTIATTALFVVVKNYYALLGLLIPALIVLLFYCSAKYQINLALIARLAFREILGQPESIAEAQRFTRPRIWQLFLENLLLGLVYLGLVLAIYLAAIVVVVVVVFALGGPGIFSSSTTTPRAAGAVLLLVLLFLVLLVLVLLLALWLGARFSLVTVALAVEPYTEPGQFIRRSWSLTQGNVWRIVLVLVVVALATAPIAGLEQVIALTIQQIIVGATSRRQATDSGLLFLATLISLALNFGVQILVVPLWQVTGAVVYHSLTRDRA